MKIRSSAAVVAALALAACGSDQSSNSGAANEAANSSNATVSANSSQNGSRTVDPRLEQEVSLAVQMLRPQLPIRQGPVTITAVEAKGAELITTMEVPTDLNEGTFEQFKQQLPGQACSNPQTRQVLDRGGSYTYVLKDTGGEEFRTTVNGC